MGYPPAPSALAGLGLGMVGMLAAALALYRRRSQQREVVL